MKTLVPFMIGVAILVACTREEPSSPSSTAIFITTNGLLTRAASPDETLITDYNLLIFNSLGILEEKVYVPRRMFEARHGSVEYSTTLLREAPYTILAAVNLGYELPFHSLEDALEYRYPMAYPDEYTQGLPMAACLQRVTADENGVIEVPLERLMARIDVQLDRRFLQEDVKIKVREVLLGNCPRSVQLFAPSRARNSGDLFSSGFTHYGNEVAPLNTEVRPGESETLPMYLLENLQGKECTPSVCSYLEIRSEYISPSRNTRPESRLIYRCYLGDGDYNLARNHLYKVTVCPEGDGLSENSWRVNQDGVY